MAYEQAATRNNPKLVLFLVDESASMRLLSGAVPKCAVVNRSVNSTIFQLVTTFTRASGVRNYIHLGVIGYGGSDRKVPRLRSLLDTESGAWTARLSEVAEMAREVEAGVPSYIKSEADGWTPMGAAMRLAGRLVDDWTREHRESPAPTVVNITDGVPTDDDAAEGTADEWAVQLQGLETEDGACLLLNVGAPAVDGEPVRRAVFPNPSELPNDEGAERLWRMSSPLPPELLSRGKVHGLLHENADGTDRRLYAQGTDETLLEKIFEFGTNPDGQPH